MITLASPFRTLSATTVTEIGKAMFHLSDNHIFKSASCFKARHNFKGSRIQPILLKRFHQNPQIKPAALASIIKPGRTTMHWQKTGQDNLTSAVVRYQLWFGAGPL